MRKILFCFIALLCATLSNAQIGYQVALLNTATGEPRSNETVTCEIKLTNSEGGTVYQGTKKATSNDFGVVSLTVGDANTFAKMDWSKLPLYISVSVEGKLVGQTEVLTVPVAEHAKHYGSLTYENISEKRVVSPEFRDKDRGVYSSIQYSFNGHTATIKKVIKGVYSDDEIESMTGNIHIVGNTIVINFLYDYSSKIFIGIYSPEDDTIYISDNHNFCL